MAEQGDCVLAELHFDSTFAYFAEMTASIYPRGSGPSQARSQSTMSHDDPLAEACKRAVVRTKGFVGLHEFKAASSVWKVSAPLQEKVPCGESHSVADAVFMERIIS